MASSGPKLKSEDLTPTHSMSNDSSWLGPPYRKTNNTDFARGATGTAALSAARTFGRLIPNIPMPTLQQLTPSDAIARSSGMAENRQHSRSPCPEFDGFTAS